MIGSVYAILAATTVGKDAAGSAGEAVGVLRPHRRLDDGKKCSSGI
jgi:hypothetical protein